MKTELILKEKKDVVGFLHNVFKTAKSKTKMYRTQFDCLTEPEQVNYLIRNHGVDIRPTKGRLMFIFYDEWTISFAVDQNGQIAKIKSYSAQEGKVIATNQAIEVLISEFNRWPLSQKSDFIEMHNQRMNETPVPPGMKKSQRSPEFLLLPSYSFGIKYYRDYSGRILNPVAAPLNDIIEQAEQHSAAHSAIQNKN